MTAYDEERFRFVARRAIEEAGFLPEQLEPGLDVRVEDVDIVVLFVRDGREVGRFHRGLLGTVDFGLVRREVEHLLVHHGELVAQGVPVPPKDVLADVLDGIVTGDDVIYDDPGADFLIAARPGSDTGFILHRSLVVPGWPVADGREDA